MNIYFSRLCLVTTVLFVFARAQADVKCWTGSGSGWSDAASWSPEGVPAADDTVCFGVSATVSPSASFAGTLVISNGTLRVVTGDDLAFTLAAKTGTTFEKTGAGTVTVRPCPAYDAGFVTDGALSILGGPAVLSGNGRLEAPGYFGSLSVAAGASVTLANAAAADRHGVITRMPAYSDSKDNFNAYAGNRTNILAKWSAAATGKIRFYDALAEGDGAFNGETVKPSDFTPGSTYVLYLTRGVVLTPGVPVSSVAAGNRSNAVYWNAGSSVFGNVWTGLAGPSTLGWATFGSVFEGTTLYPTRYAQAAVTLRKTSGLWGVDELWNGVCVKGLSLAEGATLTLGAGQAFAVADGGSLSLAGTLAGAADSVFAIMGGETTPDWTRWAGFAGTLELGAYARLHTMGTDFSARPFTLAARGTLVTETGTVGLTPATCSGILEIPADATFAADAVLLAAVQVTGPGRVVTTSSLRSPALDLSRSTTLALADGAYLGIPFAELRTARVRSAIPAFTDSVWKHSVAKRDKSSAHPLDGCRVYENGTARLTDWAQTVGGIYYNRKIGLDDQVDFSCKVATTRPDDAYPLGSYAEGWSVILNEGNAAVTGDYNQGGSITAYGVHLYMWLSYRLTWVLEGNQTVSSQNLLSAPYNYSREEPVFCRVGLTNGTMTVTLSQTGKPSYTESRNLSGAFRNGAKRYFGVTSQTGSGTWGDTTKNANFLQVDVSEPSGTIETVESVPFSETPDPKSLVTANDWNYVQNMCCTNGNEINLYAVPNGGLRGVAVNTNRFSAFQPFKIAYDYFVDWTRASGYTAEGPAIFFEDKTDNPSGGQISSLSGAGMIPKIDNCFGLWRHYYDNRSKLWEASASSSGSAVESAYWGTSRGETGERVHVELVFDGERHLETTEARTWNSKVTTYAMSHDFDQFATYVNGFFVGFAKAGGSSDSYVLARVANFGLYRSLANAPVQVWSPLAVAADASATVSTVTMVAEPTNGVVFAEVSVGDRATLALEPASDAGWLGLARLTAGEGSTVAAETGLSVALGTVVLTGETPNALTVTGAWRTFDGTLTIVVPDTWRDGFLALTLDPTRCGDPQLPTLVVKKASGARAVYQPEWRADGIYLARRGTVLLYR